MYHILSIFFIFFQRYLKILSNFPVLFRSFWNLYRYLQILADSSKFFQIFLDSSRFSQVPSDSFRFFQILSKPLRFFPNFPIFLIFLQIPPDSFNFFLFFRIILFDASGLFPILSIFLRFFQRHRQESSRFFEIFQFYSDHFRSL